MRILVSGGTATVRRLCPSWPDHLGHLMTPANGNTESVWGTGLPVGCDNGAFGGFDPVDFSAFLGRLGGKRPLWVCCPDKVGDCRTTAELFGEWVGQITGRGLPVAYVGQDGCEGQELPWERFCCLFVGGSTRWKLSEAAGSVAAEAKRKGKLLHVGRVNSLKRLRTAHDMGADSVDGKSFSAWGDTYLLWALRYIRRLEQQETLW